jgi:pyruvate dehydrogenase E2 component (dihydrolipoamide acetyltransferase)
MSREFRFPDLGEGVAEGELVKWLVKVGDSVKEDQEVAEVETDKALVPIPSPISGTVEKLHHQEGDRVKVGEVLLTFGEGAPAEKAKDQTAAKTAKASAKAKTTEKEEGEEEKGEQAEAKEEKPPPGKEAEPKPAPKSSLPPLAAPATRKLARDLNVDLETLSGSGPQGRITEEDVRGASGKKKLEVSKAPPSPLASAGEAHDEFEKYGAVERIPIKGVRRKISEHLLAASQHAVMVTHIDEAEVDQLLKIREEKVKYAEERGVKLTLLPFLMKACVIALRNHPYLNASLVDDTIVLKKYFHFGFAVDTEAGLLVPVIKDVDQKSIMRLAVELKELSEKARNRTIGLDQLRGHSFSITNIGSIGGKAFTPIIHYPDAAILGLGRTHEKAVVHKGEIAAVSVLPLCLTFDHRVTDGATAARFCNEIIKYLQDPDLLLLDYGEA